MESLDFVGGSVFVDYFRYLYPKNFKPQQNTEIVSTKLTPNETVKSPTKYWNDSIVILISNITSFQSWNIIKCK